MQIEKIFRVLRDSFSLNSKADKNGFLIPRQEKEKPCPKLLTKKDYKTPEEYENTKKVILEHYKEYSDNFTGTLNKILFTNPNDFTSKNEMLRYIKIANRDIENKKDRFKDNILLSSKEIAERKKVQQKAIEAYSNMFPLLELSVHLIHSTFINQDRTMTEFLVVDAKTPNDVIRDYEIIVNGTDKEKQALINRKVLALKKAALELSERKNSDMEYVEYFKDNFNTVFYLTELDAEKFPQLCNYLNLPSPTGEAKEFISTSKEQSNSIGNQMNILGRCLNPYYTVFNDNISKCLSFLEKNSINIDSNININIPEAFANNQNCVDSLYGYSSDCGFNDVNRGLPDNLHFFFLKNKDYSKVVDSKGKEYTLDNESIKAIAEKLKNGEQLVAYDKEGLYRTKMTLTDTHINSTPTVSNKYVKNVNFRTDPAQSFKNIQAKMKELSSVFSSDHKEFIALSDYIKDLDKYAKQGYSTSTICSNLRKLASAYVESKAINCEYDKTSRTHAREEYFTNLINNIDKAYPIIYRDPVVEYTKKIDNLEKADLTNNEFLKAVKNMNHDPDLSPQQIEAKVDAMLHTPDRQQIEVNLGENKDNAKEQIPDVNPNEGMLERELNQ